MKQVMILIGLVICLSLTVQVFAQTTLTSGVVINSSNSPGNYQYYQSNIYWSVVGIRPSSGSDFDISLYDNSAYTTYLAGSAYGGQVIDYVVGDYNHNPTPQYDYPRVNLYSGAGTYAIEWDDGADALTVGGSTGPLSWSTGHVVKAWDVYLTASEVYDFSLHLLAGSADMGIAIYKSNNATYYAGRSAAQMIADSYGAGLDEAFTYTAPTTDWYGVVVFSTNGVACTYSVDVATQLISGTDYNNSILPAYNMYNQTNIYWAVAGVRPPVGSDYDIYVYDDPNFSTLKASSAYGGSVVDFVVGDYNENPTPQWDYVKTVQYAGTGSYNLEYDDGADALIPGVNGPFTWSSNHVVKIWDVYLLSGLQYNFNVSVASGTADLGVALFKSNGAPYYAGRSSAQISADANGAGGSENFTYNVTADDWYGIVVWCNNENASANYSINVTEELLSGNAYNYGTLPALYMYNQSNVYWAATGLRPPTGSDYDLYLYDDVNFGTLLTSSTYVSGYVDFVVGDYNQNPVPQWDYPKVVQYSGTGSFDAEYDDGADALTVPGTTGPFSWFSPHVIKCWDAFLYAGTPYTFTVNVSSGTADLGIALFKSNGATYYAGRSSAQVLADNNGSGGNETFNYTPTVDDWYGFVVWSNTSNGSATYTINVNTTSTPALEVTETPISPPIVVPANGGNFSFVATAIRHQSPQAPFWVWGRDRYPNGTYTAPLLGPVAINPPVGVLVSRNRTQTVPSSYPPGLYYWIGYAGFTYSYPAVDADSFSWTKSVVADGGPAIFDPELFGEPFPYEVTPAQMSTSTPTPTTFAVHSASPNPFNPTTTISFSLPEAVNVVLNVYDVQGRLVTTLVNGTRQAGEHQVTFDGSNLSSGMYLYTLKAGEYSATGKMMLLK